MNPLKRRHVIGLGRLTCSVRRRSQEQPLLPLPQYLMHVTPPPGRKPPKPTSSSSSKSTSSFPVEPVVDFVFVFVFSRTCCLVFSVISGYVASNANNPAIAPEMPSTRFLCDDDEDMLLFARDLRSKVMPGNWTNVFITSEELRVNTTR